MSQSIIETTTPEQVTERDGPTGVHFAVCRAPLAACVVPTDTVGF
jgi:hypothetical protein